MSRQYKDIVLFTALYLVLSLPPFLVFNQEIIDGLRDRLAPVDIVVVAVLGTGALLVISVLFLADEGISRYNQFLVAPTDVLSVSVILSFLLAAVSWWLVPEFTFWLELTLSFDLLLMLVLFCQLPMVLFLSLLTAVGKA